MPNATNTPSTTDKALRRISECTANIRCILDELCLRTRTGLNATSEQDTNVKRLTESGTTAGFNSKQTK